MQRLLETKKELVCDEPEPLAIASINRHGTFFGERLAIRQPDKTPVHTACVAFGLTGGQLCETQTPYERQNQNPRTPPTNDPSARADFIPERRLDEIGADSIDMVELLVVIDSISESGSRRMNSCDSSPSMTCFS